MAGRYCTKHDGEPMDYMNGELVAAKLGQEKGWLVGTADAFYWDPRDESWHIIIRSLWGKRYLYHPFTRNVERPSIYCEKESTHEG